MDYTLPRAGDPPDIEVDLIEVPCTTNLLGVKGAGEAGAVGSPPAVVNAIIDALRPDGVTHIDMPATPEKVWQVLRLADGASATKPPGGRRRLRESDPSQPAATELDASRGSTA
jgi:aerobic carbon-monoxide dehydrogenase large subunit